MVSVLNYQPPGVTVQGTTATLVASGGVPATTVTLIGVSRGYQVATETFAITTTAKALANKGVLPDSNPAPNLKVTKQDGTVLVETTDYVLARGAGAGDSTTIARASGSTAILNGDAVVVSYAYADSTYYSPKQFIEFGSVEQVYGPALLSAIPTNPDDSQVNSPLALGARLAFENGATTVLCVAVEPSTDDVTLRQRYSEAYAKVANNPDVSLMVPLFTPPAGQNSATYTAALQGFISDVRVYCETQAAAGFGRMAFVGADTIYDDADPTFEEMAGATASRRVVIAYPNRMSLFNSSLNQTTEVGGPFLAAAYAGILAAQAPNRGLTRLQVFGFNGIPEDLSALMSLAFKNSLSAAGISVTETGRTNQLQVRHGVSSDPTDIVAQEISLTRSQDVLYRLLADGIEGAGLIGEPIDDDLTIRVKGILTGILEAAVTDLVINEWLALQVRQQTVPDNPTVIECQFSYRPFLPLNYITVAFAMDLTTGTIETGDVVAA